MPNMSSDYRSAIADYGAGLINYIGLVDNTGTEITGGDPAYARKVPSWSAAVDGVADLAADIDFDVPGTTISGWRGYSALTGGTNYGGKNFSTKSTVGQGVFTLRATDVSIRHV
jgi:hypothetical protein